MYHIPLAIPGAVVGLLARLRARLDGPAADRGDSPVPSAIIIAGLVILAIAVVTWIYFLGQGFMEDAPTDLPAPPQAPGGGD